MFTSGDRPIPQIPVAGAAAVSDPPHPQAAAFFAGDLSTGAAAPAPTRTSARTSNADVDASCSSPPYQLIGRNGIHPCYPPRLVVTRAVPLHEVQVPATTADVD